jgi:hypothetical protein
MTDYDLWRYLEQYAHMNNAWWYSVAVLPGTIISGCCYLLMWFALRRVEQLPKMFLWLVGASLPIVLILPSFYVSTDLIGALRRVGFTTPASEQLIDRATALQLGGYLSQIATLGIIGASLTIVILISAILIGGYAPPQIVQAVQSISQSFSKVMTRAFGPPRAARVTATSKYGLITVNRGEAQQGAKFGITEGAIIGKTDATIVITDAVVSRRHARFEIRNDAVCIINMGSTNGTFVRRNGNEEELNGQPYELRHGDKIFLGHPDEPESVELLYEKPLPGGQP